MIVRTRFAPSPTGPLHLGHAYAARFAKDLATRAGGEFLLRMEDIDRSRCRPHWETQIEADLRWLGLGWDGPVLRQSERGAAYRDSLEHLWSLGLLYPCRCRRRDIAEALAAPQEGAKPVVGPDGPVYPGTCRGRPRTGPLPHDEALRLDMSLALQAIASVYYYEFGKSDEGKIVTTDRHAMIRRIGDVVLSRRGMGTSYHLAVVVDDAHQQITDVTRGEDLAEATSIHVLLQRLLGLPRPRYHHHRLVRDENGKRLAKRDDARAISNYRSAGLSPEGIFALI